MIGSFTDANLLSSVSEIRCRVATRAPRRRRQQRTTNATAFCRAPPLYIVLFDLRVTDSFQAGNVTAYRAGLSDPPIRHSRSADWISQQSTLNTPAAVSLNVGPWPWPGSVNTARHPEEGKRKRAWWHHLHVCDVVTYETCAARSMK
jgi:hypothetical protein